MTIYMHLFIELQFTIPIHTMQHEVRSSVFLPDFSPPDFGGAQMHELSIAESILEIVRQYVPEDELPQVREVRVKVGTQAGIVVDSLLFSYEAITQESPLSGSMLVIDSIPFQIRCNACGLVSSPEGGTRECPNCDGYDTVVLSGTELQVVDMEVGDTGQPGEQL